MAHDHPDPASRLHMGDRYVAKLLGENEDILFASRQHPLILLAAIVSEAVLAIAVTVLITLAWRRWDPHPLLPLAYLVLLFPIISLAVDLLRWRKHQYIVTSRRVLEISGILNKEVTDSSLEKINDIRLTQTFFGRLFDFGNLEILTASESGLSRFENVREPIRLKRAMLNAKEKLEREDRGARAASAEAEVLGLLAHLEQLQQKGVLTQTDADQMKAQLLARLEARA